jgi:hypothetical protein
MDDTEASQGELLTTASSAATIPAYEPNQLQEYFDKLLPLVLGAEDSDLANSLWSASDITEKLQRFINDPQVNVIYFTKKRDKKEEGKILELVPQYKFYDAQHTGKKILFVVINNILIILFNSLNFHR